MTTTGTPPSSKWWQLRSRVRELWAQVKAENATPEKLGLAFGIGVFWGCSPFHGFQFLLCLATAWIFRLNKLATLIGLQISAPPFIPFLVFVELQLGSLLRRQQLLTLSFAELRAMSAEQLFRSLFLDLVAGGLAFGLIAAVVLGLATTSVVRKHQARKAAQG